MFTLWKKVTTTGSWFYRQISKYKMSPVQDYIDCQALGPFHFLCVHATKERVQKHQERYDEVRSIHGQQWKSLLQSIRPWIFWMVKGLHQNVKADGYGCRGNMSGIHNKRHSYPLTILYTCKYSITSDICWNIFLSHQLDQTSVGTQWP